MRHSSDRAQWEHTEEEEALYGFARTDGPDMPPSLRREFEGLTNRIAVLNRERDTLRTALDVARAALEAISCEDGHPGAGSHEDCCQARYALAAIAKALSETP